MHTDQIGKRMHSFFLFATECGIECQNLGNLDNYCQTKAQMVISKKFGAAALTC